MSENTELEKRYFDETARALRREGFQVEQLQSGQLTVILNDRPVCEVCKIGGIEYSGITTPELLAAEDTVYGIVSMTAEYMRQMEQAPPLTVSGVKDGCKVLADFNGTILAGAYGKDGIEFTTWDWGLNREDVSDEHFFGGNYKGAKQDFATRSGLIPDGALFTPKELTEVYRSIQDTFEHTGQMSEQRQRVLERLLRHIKESVPDLQERVNLCNERDQQRSVLFSVVTVTAGSEEAKFLVGGIPREYDDLEDWDIYDKFLCDIGEETEIQVHAEAYLYGNGGTDHAGPDDIAKLTKRMEANERFLADVCDNIEDVDFRFTWSPEEVFGIGME